ncbi:molybdate ABC transporter substrate-binding protein [Neisseria sp. ZJ106]|uniref:Molybdate ABC transporter substrate-binding protein n=1 Tax=Neisseria lisongii TaxID=2912188 RepID=A0ABY7RKN5_9NEIS|nr:molybdate ABC transporter substrate-binding protein [Neisseria lisongii]MCF7521302.1 molybdate ABC transporter substrate-binding protein [Neisseria lisongii]WCL72106.1 molybdate ABC transporter substrate-binding protein [Neisseria lisongii]
MNKPLLSAFAAVLFAAQVQAGEITVSAAASLKDAFGQMIAQYQARFPQSRVKLNTAGSGALLQQVAQGAPVDVVAFADEETMNQAQKKGLIVPQSRKTFARNALVVAAPIGRSVPFHGLADLSGSRFQRIALSQPQSVPVGRYAKAALETAGVWQQLQPKIITTQNVRQSLDYIARGEVDAGFVYRTDALLMKNKIKVLQIVPTAQAVSYPLALTRHSGGNREAAQFAAYVLSPQGQQVLKRYGFGS